MMTQVGILGNNKNYSLNIDTLEETSLQGLRKIAQTQCNWIGVHALEALIDLGEFSMVEDLMPYYNSFAQSPGLRVGIFRVRARISSSFDEWNDWKEKLEKIYIEDGNSDRLQALESLCKLGVVPSSQVKEKAYKDLNSGRALAEIYAAWVLSLAHDSNGLERLRAFLRSEDTEMRRKAAYIITRFNTNFPENFRNLVEAYDLEPENTDAKLYMACALLMRKTVWNQQESIINFLETSLTSISPKQKLEVFQTLMQYWEGSDIVRVVHNLDNYTGDGKIGALLAVLYVFRKEGISNIRENSTVK